MNDLMGIFENKKTGKYFWLNGLSVDEIKEAEYLVDKKEPAGYHICIKSALYDDMTGYVDKVQKGEENLRDNELYVVLHYGGITDPDIDSDVDFGITKKQILDNVKAQKYVEGAVYFTIGQMFYTTKMTLEEKYER